MPDNRSEERGSEVIGLIPAAGQAVRIGPLPCSKELYPIGFEAAADNHSGRPKVVCHYLLEKMKAAGAARAFIILRKGKWDIPAYLGDGAMLDMRLAYLMMGLPYGAPYTVDQAYPFVRDAIITFGFPDMLFEPKDAFARLLKRQKESGADVILGIFPADRPEKVDMVDVGEDGAVQQIVIKPQQTELCFTWGIAVWTPVFSNFMHEYLAVKKKTAASEPELFMGDVVQAAIDDGLPVEAVQVSDQPFLDIGTGEDLIRAVRAQSKEHEA